MNEEPVSTIHGIRKEIKALSFIYKGTFKEFRIPEQERESYCFGIKVTLSPKESENKKWKSNPPMKLDLIVKFPPNYPAIVPYFAIQNPVNIPMETINEILKNLHENAKCYINSPMVHLFANTISECLSDLYDRMEGNVRNDQAARSDEVYQEINERRKQNRKAARKRLNTIVNNSIKTEVVGHLAKENKIKRMHSQRTGETITFKNAPAANTPFTVIVGQRMPEFCNKFHDVFYCTDTKTGTIMNLYSWVFALNGPFPENFLDNCQKQIDTIFKEFNALAKAKSDVIIKCIAYKLERTSAGFYIDIVTEHIMYQSFASVMTSFHPLSPETMKRFTTLLVESLINIHALSLVHRSIQLTNVFLDPTGKIKVAEVSIVKRLDDFNNLFQNKISSENMKGCRKSDVKQLGLVLLSCFVGSKTTYGLSLPDNISEEFRDFITNCSDGVTTSVLANHPFIKGKCEENYRTRSDSIQIEDTSLENSMFQNSFGFGRGHTRLETDFEIINSIGHGGFGEVIKVKNKLDSSIYAIKIIDISSQGKHATRIIMREAKLLSKLNHPNVVRYYSTWCDRKVKTRQISDSSDATTELEPSSCDNELHPIFPKFDFSSESVSNSTPNGNGDRNNDDTDDTEEDEDEEGSEDDELFQDSIIFSTSHRIDTNGSAKTYEKSVPADQMKEENINSDQVLFIQMECCEGRSLRHVIDNGILLENPENLWTLFHEILKGMSYIHSKGIIHRDLKPGNIFLDSQGHAKIGDFGLATVVNFQQAPGDVVNSSHNSLSGLTAQAGTTLYMAPEVLLSKNLPPTQKIDMYSLGIIFFEMLNPFNTGMERIKVITEIRKPDFVFTDKRFSAVELSLLNQLLCHNPLKRPSAAEILSSKVLPAIKTEEIDGILKQALTDKKSAQFCKVVQSLLFTENTKAINATYDSEFFKHAPSLMSAALQESVKNYFVQLFLRHGAVPVQLPLFMPKSQAIQNEVEIQNLQLMTSAGCVVVLPHSLRASFARYIAQNGVRDMKSYQIRPVYRECSAEMHPREITECAFDIVFTCNSLLPELELLSLIEDVLEKYPVLKERDTVLNVSHASLLPAIFSNCGVGVSQREKIMTFLAESQLQGEDFGKQLRAYLGVLDITEENANKLFSLLTKEGPFDCMIPHFRCLIKQKNDRINQVKTAMEDLTTIASVIKEMDFPVKVHLSPCLTYKGKCFSGFIFQLLRRKFGKKPIFEIIACGGRYDKLIETFSAEVCKKYDNTHAVGISFAIERIAYIVEAKMKQNETASFAYCDNTVYAVSEKPIFDGISELCKEIWRARLPANIIYKNYTNKAFEDSLSSISWKFLISIKDEGDEPEIKLRTVKNERLFEKNATITDVVKFISYQRHPPNSEGEIWASPLISKGMISQSEYHSLSQINVINLTVERQSNFKKKLEMKMHFRLAIAQQLFNPKINLNVIAVECSIETLRELQSEINLDANVEAFTASWHAFEKKYLRSARSLSDLYHTILRLRFNESERVLVLYSAENDSYIILIAA